MKNLMLIVLTFLLFSCEKSEKTVQEKPINDTLIKVKEVEDNVMEDPPQLSKEKLIRNANDEVLDALKSQDYLKFSENIHPQKGVQFSMYAYVEPQFDKKFSRADFEKYINSNVKFTWGDQDGSGEEYVTTLKNYLQKWVLKNDYAASSYSLNDFQGGGNSLNNLKEVYPKSDFTENYVEGSEKYGGMDWKTVRFVFEKLEGRYYLVAVVNDEWTI